ncbi:carboxypeptidase-like regulatory domain-containing protein [Algoriphagus zhangzhouensis]|uniref:CarboxypepD_reg-like domain-containing protein n=1 Tax=Algoriphagus zhangzhouensis TaxID=1073327 RepID=A0A1M7ZBF2_9BACT|nr:carboxypeptidase-like regulatory domain-containing protein [Algoriphagus zhangzhouensis]TDY46806.1 carboxypeptidase-like protein [Algoriphagus zhangzhouensis]SHO62235.1 CarboxypepD_reg-like domain-containing protein [Algoriphagus zhangzhouensis]
MSQIISTYPIFEGSQVLTSDQLNQLSAYLDQQNRLTRSKLIGMGIVCGLQIQPFPNGLSISKGLGITSEGFLIQNGKRFDATHYRPYTLPEGVSYKPFGFPEQDVTLWELLSEEPEDETDVKKLNNPATFLNNKFVLLYLEIFDKDLKSCLGNACDDKGQDRLLTLRRLVVSKADLDIILTRSSNVSGEFSADPDLKNYHFKKPLFSPSTPESTLIGPFISHYQNTITETVTTEYWDNLAQGYKVFEPLLAKSFGFSNPFDSAPVINKIDQINQSLTDAPVTVLGIQYLYDFFKELNLAWDEFLETGLSLWYSCPTDPSLFPLHLMLGRAIPASETAEEFYKYRHGLVQPPIFNGQKLLQEKLNQQYRRLVLMIENLELGILREPSPEDFPIKITPSIEKYDDLGSRSIPYYYDINGKGSFGSWFSLEKNWKAPGTLQLRSSDRPEVLAYDNQPDTPVANPDFLESPLNFNWDPYPFLRIEGHLGHNIEDAKTAIQNLINQFNLPIHLEALHLDAGGTLTDSNCGWNDLQEEYMHHRFLLLGLIRDISEGIEYFREINIKYYSDDPIYDEEQESEVLEAFKLFQDWNESLPECLEDLDWDIFQESYKKILQRLLDIFLIEMTLLDDIDLTDDKEIPLQNIYSGLIARASPIVYRVLDLFYFTKIQRLFLSYLHRKEKLHNSKRFTEYIQQNPGVNHEAGVYKGGTFILLYMTSSQRVIGDFSLPGAACDCQCIDSCEGDDWNLLPPFARPDYAVTMENTPVEIPVVINDRLPIEREYVVELLSEFTEKGGKVSQIGSSSTFLYEPPEGFSGDDSFNYKLVDKASELSDVGRVTIWVKEANPTVCYTEDILNCWGIDNVTKALSGRNLDSSNNPTQTLLDSLRETSGFTLAEMEDGILSSQQALEQLLNCLQLLVDGMTQAEMRQAILDYQAANCGAQPEPTCTSTGVIGQVIDASGEPISGVQITIEGGQIGTVTDLDGRFTLQFPNPGVTLQFAAVGFVSNTRDICDETQITHILTSVRVSQPAVTGVSTSVATLDATDMFKLASSRGLITDATATPDKNDLIVLLQDDKQEISLANEELSLLKNDTLKVIADENDLQYRSNSTKASLVEIISTKK